ncbi:MAG: hypothetical protein V7719_13435 [Psychroserpens sp.]|uniref:hypothetical protein n=1 Tax=Psychroserpens sp. TaxID=2020870 RepID=UPI0030019266
MLRYTYCTSCKKDFIIKSQATTRPDLQMEKGDEFVLNCKNCGKTEKKHINDVKAEIDNRLLIASLALGVIATVVLWIYFGAIGTASAIIPLLIWQQQMSSVKTFNSYMIKRK